jgi:hypothetical protein
MGLKNIMNKGKDLTISKALKFFINGKIKNYGKVGKIDIDSTQKTIDMELALKGETDSISVNISNYCLEKENNVGFFRFSGVEASRLWLANIIKDHICGNKVQVPDKYVGMIDSLL